MLLLSVAQHLVLYLQMSIAAGPPDPGQDMKPLLDLLAKIRTLIYAIGLTACAISVIVAGVMRMAAYGNERRVAMSNMAMIAAIVGLVIMVMAAAILNFIQNGLSAAPTSY